MYHILYPNDTPENRATFLSDWIQTQFRKQDEVCYQMSAETLAKNITRYFFHVEKDAVIAAFTKQGYITGEKYGNTYFNIDPESSGIKQIKKGWD